MSGDLHSNLPLLSIHKNIETLKHYTHVWTCLKQ